MSSELRRPPANLCMYCDQVVWDADPVADCQAVCRACFTSPKRFSFVRDPATGESKRIAYVSAYARWYEQEKKQAREMARRIRLFTGGKLR